MKKNTTLKIVFLVSLVLVLSSATQLYVVINKEIDITEDNIIEASNYFAKLSSAVIVKNYKTYYESEFYEFKKRTNDILETNSYITGVQIVDLDGTILFDSSELRTGKYSGPDKIFYNPSKLNVAKKLNTIRDKVSTDGKEQIEIIYPYVGENRQVEYVMIYYFSLDQMHATNNEIIFNNILLMLSLTIASGLIIFFLLRKLLLHPLSILSKGFKAFREGDQDYEVKLKTDDEFGDIGREFNRMADKLNESKKRLEEQNKHLEIKVEENTKEIESKKQDLYKYNDLSIGQGLKVIELKNKIAELEEQLKQMQKK